MCVAAAIVPGSGNRVNTPVDGEALEQIQRQMLTSGTTAELAEDPMAQQVHPGGEVTGP